MRLLRRHLGNGRGIAKFPYRKAEPFVKCVRPHFVNSPYEGLRFSKLPIGAYSGSIMDSRDVRPSDSSDVLAQRYAFLVSEPEFDATLGRSREAGIESYSGFDLAQARRNQPSVWGRREEQASGPNGS